MLAGVVVWQQKRIDTISKEKDALQEKRYVDLMQMKDKYAEVMSSFSNTAELLYNKLAGKKE